jgi:uncharacterized protein (DUF2236 family)
LPLQRIAAYRQGMARQRSDAGLFGPGSVTWRVHGSPVMLIGGLRALIIQALHPLALAGVAEHSDFRARPLYRLRRTAEYVATVTFADSATARSAGEHVRRIHTFVHGTDPVTGRAYSAQDPDTLLWVHCVEAHSFLAAYRAYGGSLTAADQDRYLAESARAAALVGIPPEMVPASTEAMRAYFAQLRDTLVASDAARDTIRFVVRPPLTRELLALQPALRLTAAAAVGLVPRDLRRLAGVERPWIVDAATHVSVGAAARTIQIALRVPLAEAGMRRARHAMVG